MIQPGIIPYYETVSSAIFLELVQVQSGQKKSSCQLAVLIRASLDDLIGVRLDENFIDDCAKSAVLNQAVTVIKSIIMGNYIGCAT